MNELQRLDFQKCDRWQSGCNASVCPLYHQIESTYFIKGDARCTKLLDYLERKELPPALLEHITRTEPVWRAILGESLLATWVRNRNAVREHFKSAS